MKSYYAEVKAWLDGPGDGRIPSEALVGLVLEHEQALALLKEISHVASQDKEWRKRYLELTVQRDPSITT